MTISEIAKIAGVSQSTVSRSLNDSPRISDATKQKVLAIARQHNYQMNMNARGLKMKQTQMVGIFVPGYFAGFENGLYVQALLRQLVLEIEKSGYFTVVSYYDPAGRANQIGLLMEQKRLDGCIIMTPDFSEETFAYLNRTTLPFVYVHMITRPTTKNVTLVNTDHYRGGHIAGQHLAQNGHRQLLTLSSVMGEEFSDRTRGFAAALAENGIRYDEAKTITVPEPRTIAHAYQSVLDNLPRFAGVTGVFAQSDVLAIGAYRALAEKGLRVPEDISLIGYDDVEALELFRPGLTTVRQNAGQIAESAVQSLLHYIKAPDASRNKTILIEPTLVVRDTVRDIR